MFGPELEWKPWLNEPIFRHPALDFANSHFYEEGTIDYPPDTVAPAISAGRLVREALGEIRDRRPSSTASTARSTPSRITAARCRSRSTTSISATCNGRTSPRAAAGGGMRWPNRHPHTLTRGMRRAQRALSGFLPLVDWPRFRRRPLAGEATVSEPAVHLFACGDAAQAVLYLLRTDTIGPDGMLRADAAPLAPTVTVPDLEPGVYRSSRGTPVPAGRSRLGKWSTRAGR